MNVAFGVLGQNFSFLLLRNLLELRGDSRLVDLCSIDLIIVGGLLSFELVKPFAVVLLKGLHEHTVATASLGDHGPVQAASVFSCRGGLSA